MVVVTLHSLTRTRPTTGFLQGRLAHRLPHSRRVQQVGAVQPSLRRLTCCSPSMPSPATFPFTLCVCVGVQRRHVIHVHRDRVFQYQLLVHHHQLRRIDTATLLWEQNPSAEQVAPRMRGIQGM